MTRVMNQWYVLRAVFRHEVVVRDALRKAGFRCYVPMTWRVDTASNIHQCQVVCHKSSSERPTSVYVAIFFLGFFIFEKSNEAVASVIHNRKNMLFRSSKYCSQCIASLCVVLRTLTFFVLYRQLFKTMCCCAFKYGNRGAFIHTCTPFFFLNLVQR